MRSFAVILSTLVAAAAASGSYTLPTNFNIGQTTPAERNSWCLAERNACPKICGGTTNGNSCDPDTLTFTCVCSNGTTADVEPYTQTVPFFVCQATYGQCIAAAATLDDDEKCKEAQKKCGSEDPFKSDSSTTTTSSSSAPTATETESSSERHVESSATASTTTSSTASAETSNAAIRMGQEHSSGMMATVLFFAARLLL